MSTLVLLRPWWLLALLPLALLWWWRRRRGDGAAHSWQQAVDAHLLPHLLIVHSGNGAPRARWIRWLLPLAGVLGVIALAGPSWRQVEVPLYQSEAPLVIALDLSSGMRAADLKPSRLAQVRQKLKQLVDAREGGQMGLLVFAADAYTAAPITRDAQTLDAILDALSPDLLPADGHAPDRALRAAVEMMRKAGFRRGQVLLLSDHADARSQKLAAELAAEGFQVLVLGVGTPAGAPLSNARGFVTDAAGQLQLARLDEPSLQALAQAGGGRYAQLRQDLGDLRALGVLAAEGDGSTMAAERDGAGSGGLQRTVQRSDDGYWLLPGLLLLAALAWWQRGRSLLSAVLGGALLLGLGGSPTQLAQAAEDVAAPAAAAVHVEPQGWQATWEGLWQRRDQQARAALDAGDPARARALATDDALRGSAAYQAGDFAAAAAEFESSDDPVSQYNRGTALARAGEYEEALKALDQALAQAPQMEDAIANRQAILDFLEKQKQQQQQQQQQGQGEGEPQDGEQQQQQSSAGDQQQDPSKQQGQSQDGSEGEPQQGESPADGADQSDQSDQDSEGQKSSTKPDQESDKEPESAAARPASEAEEKAQQEASAAARQAMEQALEQQQQARQEAAGEPGNEPPQTAAPMTAEQRSAAEQQQALQQWLKRVPDDPGALLRRKFALEQQRRTEAARRAARAEENR